MIKKVRLGVNIDHVLQSEMHEETYTQIHYEQQYLLKKRGRFNNYTFKRDRRHIRDQDLKIIKKN